MENNAPDDRERVARRSLPNVDLRAKFMAQSKHSAFRRSAVLKPTNRLNTNSTSRKGLLSPPSSQTMDDDMHIDPSKTLISPPPEEALRPSGRHHSSHNRANSNNFKLPFTPSLLATPLPSSSNSNASKRKRPGVAGSSPMSHALEITEFPRHCQATIAVGQSPGHVVEATPNPRYRKQLKRHTRNISVQPTSSSTHDPRLSTVFCPQSYTTPTKPGRKVLSPAKGVLLESPHATNPDADFIPPMLCHSRQSLSSRRRSVTPLPAYVSPPEKFTPPQEILATPVRFQALRAGKSSKRKSLSRQKLMKLVIKNEPPDVDLSLPLPPPSPTDDPLLLLGPARRSLVASSESAPRSPDLSREDGVIVQSHVTDVCITSSQVSTSPIPNEDVTGFDFGACADDSADLSMAEMLPLFDLDELPSSNGGWTDSDSDSGTDFDQSGDYTGKFTMMKVPTKVDPPTSGTRDRINRWGRPVSPFPGAKRKVKGSLKKDGDNSLFDDSDDARDGSSGGVSMLVVDNRPDVSIPEPYDVRDDLLASLPGGVVSDNSDDDANDSSIEVGMVKITSDDPRAAARAAAILKQHDYDCFTPILYKHRRHSSYSSFDSLSRTSRRKHVSESGVTKTAHHARPQTRRHTTVGGVVGDMVFIPGSPAMSLPELLQEAEVGLERQESAVAQTLRSVPVPLPASPTPSPGARCSPVKESEPSKDRTPVPSDTDQREWTRDHWKQLDACFTDERIEVGTRLGLGSDVLANVDEVEIENVVTRFLSIAGGPDIADPSSRPRWAKEGLFTRVRALQKKQRLGNAAFPLLNISCEAESTRPPSHPPLSIGKRVKGFLYSYLPMMSKPSSSVQRPQSSCPLPLPPPEILQKPRGPISTPIRPAVSKPTHPKDVVHLQPAPIPRVSLIPRVSKPQRLVELHPIVPVVSPQSISAPRVRKSSGTSVKDLVRGFEELGEQVTEREAPREIGLKRVRSNRSGVNVVQQQPKLWKP